MNRRTPAVEGIAIFLLAAIVRGLYVWQIRSAPFFDVLVGDAQGYDVWAREIASGDWLGHEVFYQTPLYPYFLGTIYAISGHDLLVVRIIQAIVGSCSCVFLWAAGRRLFSRPVGIAAGVVLALYGPAIFFDALIQKSVLDSFFLCLSLWLLGRLVDRPSRPAIWFALGTALGALCLTRENALFLAPVLLVWILVRRGAATRLRAQWAAMLLLGLAVLFAPVAIRNRVVGGEWHITTSQFGPNFYIGNNEDSDGLYAPLRPGRGSWEYERRDATEIAEQALGRPLRPAEVSKYWTDRTLATIRAHPGHWLTLLGRKLVLSWNAIEIVDTESQAIYEEHSPLLRSAARFGHFGILVPFAFAGIWMTWRDRSRLWLLYAILVGYTGTLVLFCVYARYRYPLVPVLVLFGAAGVVELARRLRERSLRPLAAPVAGMAAMAVLCNWPILSVDGMRAVTENNLGTALQEQGRLDEAVLHYRRALDFDPAYAPVHGNLAAALAQQGRFEEAAAQFREAIRVAPENGLAQSNFGRMLLEMGDYEQAVRQLERALQIFPDDVDALNDLGVALGFLGRHDEAVARLEAAVRLDPRSEEARRNLEAAREARRREEGGVP